MSLRAPATRLAPAPEEYESVDRDLYLDARLAAAAFEAEDAVICPLAPYEISFLGELIRLEQAGAIRVSGRVVQIHRVLVNAVDAQIQWALVGAGVAAGLPPVGDADVVLDLFDRVLAFVRPVARDGGTA